MFMHRVAIWVVMSFILVGCDPQGGVSTDARGCASGGGKAEIEWVDFIQWEGITYSADFGVGGSPSLDKRLLGPILGRTRCKLADVVTDPEYDSRDGDASFLPAGTSVYEVEGYEPSFRVAARHDGRLVLYEADRVPGAEHGRDLLDVEGKVVYIGVNSPKNGTKELAAVRGRRQVLSLVEMLLAAPVDQDRSPSEDEYDDRIFIEFHLEDGTSTSDSLYPESGLLSRGILVPESFVAAIQQAAQRTSR